MNRLAEYAERELRETADREDAGKALPQPGEATGPIDKAGQSERERAIEECLEQLAEPHRMVIVLRDYDGLEWNEIAARMGKDTDSAVRELHRRALLELAKLLRRRGLGPEQA